MVNEDKTFGSAKDDPAYRSLAEPGFDAEKMLAGLEGIKVSSQKDAINDIKEMVAERDDLNKDIYNDIEKMKTEMSNLIFQLNVDTDRLEILNLKKRMFDFDELKIQEKLNHFRDIALLKRELREREKEFTERESRVGVLDELLQS